MDAPTLCAVPLGHLGGGAWRARVQRFRGHETGPTTTWTGGLRNVEAQLPVNASTAFRVASISKAAVAVGFFKLWANGEIGLDDDINDVLSNTLSALWCTLNIQAYHSPPHVAESHFRAQRWQRVL